MRVLFDTDVVLDVLLDRRPHSDCAAALLSLVESGSLAGFLCATSVTTIHYLAVKAVGAKQARAHIQRLLSLLDIAPVNRRILDGALKLDFADFEDAVTHEAARLVRAEAIVTRNLRDFRGAAVPVHSSADFLLLLAARRGKRE